MSRGKGVPDSMAKRVGYCLKMAQNSLRTRMEDELRPLGITAPQYAVLTALEMAPGLSNADLARAAFVTAQTMQGIVTNLERDGFVKRTPDPQHGRVLKAEVTEDGLKVLRKAHIAVAKVETAMLSSFSKSEITSLAEQLTRCAENLAV